MTKLRLAILTTCAAASLCAGGFAGNFLERSIPKGTVQIVEDTTSKVPARNEVGELLQGCEPFGNARLCLYKPSATNYQRSLVASWIIGGVSSVALFMILLFIIPAPREKTIRV